MEFRCNTCNKQYKSYQSLWNHNKRYHNTEIAKSNPEVTMSLAKSNPEVTMSLAKSNPPLKNDTTVQYTCMFCNKIYKYKQGKWRHEQKCSKLYVAKQNEITTRLDKIESIVNKPTIINNINNINNGIINNKKIVINKIGQENINLNNHEIADIFNKQIDAVSKTVEYIYFNERIPSNHSFCTTAIDSQYLSVYDTKSNQIIKDRKKYFLNDVLTRAIDIQETLYNKFKTKFSPLKKSQIEDNIKNLKRIRDSDYNDKILQEINLLTYNKRVLVQNTWDNIDDLTEPDDFNFLKDLENPTDNNITFNHSDSSDTSESEDDKPQLISCKQPSLITNKKPKNIEL